MLNENEYRIPHNAIGSTESPLQKVTITEGIDFEQIDLKKLQLSGESAESFKSVEEYIYLFLCGHVEARPPYHRLGVPIPNRDGRLAVQHPLARLVRPETTHTHTHTHTHNAWIWI